jgi:YfiH family protein
LFQLDSGQIYRSEALQQFPWLDHGFGTRRSVAWPPTANIATLRQIHSNRVVIAKSAGDLGEGDALISNVPGLMLAIRTADCVPILVADPKHRAVAAIHAGWRGTARQILMETTRTMAEEFGTCVQDLVIAVGPAIGACCYEVGPEVARQFAEFFPELADLDHTANVDLAEANLRQLRRNGGTVGQLDTSGLCTHCLADRFHSYRRDREAAGRMVSAIEIR